jgi:hypothetical protein
MSRVRLEILLTAARGESVYVNARSVLGCDAFFAEAVSEADCAGHGDFSTTLEQHCRGRQVADDPVSNW